MQKITALAVSVLLALCFPAAAQTQEQVKAAADELIEQELLLAGNIVNLFQISGAASESDRQWATHFTDSAAALEDHLFKVYMFATIYAEMHDPRDAAIVSRHLRGACNSLVKSSRQATSAANKALGVLRAPGLVQEVSKARDQIDLIGQSRLCRIAPAAN